MGGAEDVEDEEEEEEPGGVPVCSVDDINHLGGSMACLGGWWGGGSFRESRPGRGSGSAAKRTPSDSTAGQEAHTEHTQHAMHTGPHTDHNTKHTRDTAHIKHKHNNI